jgi:hypothetical protein
MLMQVLRLIGRHAIAAAAKSRVSAGMLLCAIATTLLTISTACAHASLARKSPSKATNVAKKEETAPKGLVMIDVSIANQRLTLFDDGVPIAHAPVSTGMSGHPTPLGVFSVIQKQKWHESNIYSGAPMPYMQRITWSGVAMHAGVLPGYPASHGCIRLPHEFAVRLFGMTKMGARVFVTRNEIAPAPFVDAHLFTPPPTEASAAPQPVEALGQPNGSEATRSDERLASVNPAVPMNRSNDTHALAGQVDATNVTDSVSSTRIDPASGEQQNRGALKPDAADQGAQKQRESKTAESAGAGVNGTLKVADAANKLPADAANVDSAILDVPLPQARPQLPQLKPGPLSIFISRKLKRLFVRKGFDPIFDAPVEISDPERPFGTHVFMAMGFTDDRSAMRWLLVSMPSEAAKAEERAGKHKQREAKVVVEPPLDTYGAKAAAAALERIEVPADARDQIAQLLSPGTSLIISDKDLGPETGSDDTDFVVLTR